MAFFQINFFSQTLGFNTDVNVFIPTPNSDEVLNNKNSDYFQEGALFQALYLLHGAYGDHTDWFRLTSIEKYATLRKLAVIMPAASNSFYQNMYRGSAYLDYLTEELPAFIEKMFPVSRKREDTFIAGLSMGGYGALRIAFEKPERFAACASLSGALDLKAEYEESKDEEGKPFRWKSIFQHPEALEGTEADLFALLQKRIEEGRPVPRIFQTVGTEDFLYQMNVAAKERFAQLGVDYTYTEHPGIHDWDFWDRYIQEALEWFGLKNDSIRCM